MNITTILQYRAIAARYGRPLAARALCINGVPLHWAVIALATNWRPK